MELAESQNKEQKAAPLKVLIADDDTPTRILLRAAISQWGYEIHEAKDGEEAWGILQNPNAPRLLIIDWLMPKLDGLALCERIKNELKFYPYIILLTQQTGTTNVVKGLEAGADEFLSKPFNMAELRSRLTVGARIVNYDLEKAEQNRSLHELTAMTAAITQEMTEVLKSFNTSEKSPEASQQLDKLQSLQKKLIELTEKLTSMEKPPKAGGK